MQASTRAIAAISALFLALLPGCERSGFLPIAPDTPDTVRIAIYDRSSKQLRGTLDVSGDHTISIENALEIPQDLIRYASEQDTLLITTAGDFDGMRDELVLLYTGELQDIPSFWSAQTASLPGGVRSTGGTRLGPSARLFVFALDTDDIHSGSATIAIGPEHVLFDIEADRHTVVLSNPASVALSEPTEMAMFKGAGSLGEEADPRIFLYFRPGYYTRDRRDMFTFLPTSSLGRPIGDQVVTLFAFAIRTP